MMRARPVPEQQCANGRSWLAAWSLTLVALLFAACTTTTTTTSGNVGDVARDVPRTESDTSNAERRADVRTELAKGYFTQGQYATALDEIKQALAAKPDMRDAINLRGLVYAAMGETQLADESFRRALEMFPHDPDILHNYGWFLCQQRRYPAAYKNFELAVAQPNYRGVSRTLLARGVCELNAGQADDAQRTLTKAFEYDPSSPAISYNLANLLYRSKDYERARFYIRRVNARAEQGSAQSYWLELRIERKLGNAVAVQDLGMKMRKEFAQSPETQALGAGQFDE